MDDIERAATNRPSSAQGYVMPYWDVLGKPLPFYRVCVTSETPEQFFQPKETGAYVYFPRYFMGALSTESRYLIVTEREANAVAACGAGFPCVAIASTDGWRNRVIRVPEESSLSTERGILNIVIPSDGIPDEDWLSPLSLGFQELIDFAIRTKREILCIFDSDKFGVRHFNQKAIVTMAFELRFRGIPFNRIRQAVLPHSREGEVNSIASLLVDPDFGSSRLQALIETTLTKKSAFPRHPNLREYLNTRLQAVKIGRKEMQSISLAILSDLDTRGIRLFDRETLEPYFFDKETHRLIQVAFGDSANAINDTPWGKFMYTEYGLAPSDQRLIVWLGTQFQSEAPIEDVSPFRILARKADAKVRGSEGLDDHVNFQLSDGQFVRVSKDGIKILDNGEDSILFESGQCLPLDADALKAEFDRQSRQPLVSWWSEAFKHVRLRDTKHQADVMSLLYYLSPWLYKWRGLQLPVEMVLGEAGSGKSSLCELRLQILTGEAHLRNAPSDIRDWHASIASTGGLHVTDNVQLVDRNMRQKLSDDICRIVTEPDPHIEMRKLFTTASLMRAPIRAVFLITAIQQPFINADILQRSIILELDKGKDIIAEGGLRYNSEWVPQRLNERGGRIAWVAHHLLVLQRFFQLVSKQWDPSYSAKHRLIHLEQSMLTMAKLFGMEVDWLPSYLMGETDKALTESDWAFEGLVSFCTWYRSFGKNNFTVQQVIDYIVAMDEFNKCEVLTNGRKLGRYMQSHKTQLASMAGIIEDGLYGNRIQYKFL